MRSPGIPRNLKKSHSAGKYTVRTRFPGFFQKTSVFPSRGTQTDVPGNRGNAIWAMNSLGFVRSPGAPVGQEITILHTLMHAKVLLFVIFWDFEDPQRIANGGYIHSPNAISWDFLGPPGVRAREERSPSFPEIAEMQFEQGKHKGSCDSRAPRWDGKSQNDTLFWPQK